MGGIAVVRALLFSPKLCTWTGLEAHGAYAFETLAASEPEGGVYPPAAQLSLRRNGASGACMWVRDAGGCAAQEVYAKVRDNKQVLKAGWAPHRGVRIEFNRCLG